MELSATSTSRHLPRDGFLLGLFAAPARQSKHAVNEPRFGVGVM